MVTTIHWPVRRHPWVIPTLLVISLILFMWGLALAGNKAWWIHFWIMLQATMVAEEIRGLPFVLSGGVLGVPSWQGQMRYIPLAMVDATATPSHWRLEWTERNRRKQVKIRRDPALDRLLESGLTAARQQAATGVLLPDTERQAALDIAVATPILGASRVWMTLFAVGIIGMLTLGGLALWLDQPAFLLPLVLLPYLYARYSYRSRCVLTADGLFMTAPGSEAVRIPLSDVVEVSSSFRSVAVIRTSHPDFPAIRVNEHQSLDLLRRLRSRVRGYAHKTPGLHLSEGLRCTLCGNVMEPGAHSLPGTVLICERCSDRTRYEAQQGGHGPAGSGPRPIG